MEANTYATSLYIDRSVEDVRAYIASGDSLTEYTLFSRMQERVDEQTWLGTASGYQRGLYYHVEERRAGDLAIVEWHCGHELGAYFHVYPMVMIPPSYFGSAERGTYYHWISFVDPARATPMITQGLPTVHRSEARSMKGHLERRAGLRAPSVGALELSAHTIFVQAPVDTIAALLDDPAERATWSYPLRTDGSRHVDHYDREVRIATRVHDVGPYRVVEHDTHYVESNATVRAPFLVIPTSFAFAVPGARGSIVHRLAAWPREGGSATRDDYDTESINLKRIVEGRLGDRTTYSKGCSYLPAGDDA